MPNLYSSVDCVVVPSRGEGWGRPHIEAMAMGLPVIATRWSGNTAFMDDTNSFLVRIDGLVHPNSGPFRRFKWAQPSVAHLREQLRYVFEHPQEARSVGQVARAQITAKYSPQQVAAVVKQRLRSWAAC
eukprot:TRINITY_DN7193_c0_g2_i3.p2 TRINITY_DN7193_c0_g2~~TRINITY_DN7193_c0_g2_i3.p2  ORF type:complete len:129 (+),score=16.27 TRINITY_DN7193_c0_g2_i3:228-614(+)